MDGKADAAMTAQRKPPPPPRAEAAEQSKSLLRGMLDQAQLLPPLACLLVAAHFALTAYRARRDPGDLAFVLAAYATLAILFRCIASRFDALADADADQPGGASGVRGRLRACVWALSSALTVSLTFPPLPPWSQLISWAMSVLISICAVCLLVVPGVADAEIGTTKWNDGSSEIEEKE